MDSIFIKDFGFEKYLFVMDGASKHTYKTIQISSPANFFSIIPIQFCTDSSGFYRFYVQLVKDSLCQGLIENAYPDESLQWILESYMHTEPEKCFKPVLFDSFSSFKPYYVMVEKKDYPYLLENAPKNLTNSEFMENSTKEMFVDAAYFLIIYWAHNHFPGNYKPTEPELIIQKSSDSSFYKTAHGIAFKNKGKIRWLFISDNIGMLRHASIRNVMFSNFMVSFEQVSVYSKKIINIDLKKGCYSFKSSKKY
ncbi:MAG: hypothetical protein JW915_15195 [Chitinispirillaceae bacterium]|nr:hypothetical protein [Chitinispirillaceae bacterium]